MDSTLLGALMLGLVGFTLGGYLSAYKILLIISVVFAVTLAFEFGERGDMILAVGLAGLALFNTWAAYAHLSQGGSKE